MEMKKWLIIVLVLGIATAIIAVAAVVIKKKKSKAEIQENKGYDKPVVQAKTTVEAEPVAEEKITVKEEPAVDKNLQSIADGIRENVNLFNGLFEGVFQIVHNSDNADSDAMEEWKIRTENINGNDNFKAELLKLLNSGDIKNQAAKLLNCIELAGIKRAEETEYAFEINVSKKYICLSNNLDEGTLCTVLKPYWHLDSKVVEQGCIIRKDG